MNAFCVPLFLFPVFAPQAKPDEKLTSESHLKADYEARLNDILGKGITPEKNAVVLLWKAFGPTPEGGNGMPAEFFKRLGIPEPPKQGDYFVGMYRYLADHLKLDRDDHDPINDQQGWATKQPWAAKDYPQVAAWLKLNEKPLVVVVEASKRPDYYNPLVSRKTEKDPGALIGVLLPGVQKCRELGAALCARAMLKVEEGKYDEAWQDLLAAHRLGRLVARGGTLIEALVGIAVDTVASNAELAYLERAKLSSKQILDRLKDLRELPLMPSMADKIDTGERHMYLDSLQLIRRGGVGQLEGLADGKGRKPTPEELQALAMIDWEPAIKTGNKFYDRMAAAIRLKDRAEREKAFDKIEADLKTLKRDAANQARIIGDVLRGKDPGKDIGKAIGDILICLLMPAIQKVQSSRDRSEQIERNLHIAFAMAAYHRDTGRYPAKLDDLAPKYLATVPDDIFTGKPLTYKPTEKGYLFYSVGQNGKDEGGQWHDDDPPGDDPRVRMPLPPLKKNK
jgi:hypothetical protein